MAAAALKSLVLLGREPAGRVGRMAKISNPTNHMRRAGGGALSCPLNRGSLSLLGHLRLLLSIVSGIALFCDCVRSPLNHLVDPFSAFESWGAEHSSTLIDATLG